MSGQILNSVAAELAGICAAPVSEEDRARAALHVLDWAACAIAGSVSDPARILGSSLRDEGPGQCTVIGARSAPALTAVMVNGALGNVLEMDDVDKRAILHPGPVVIPAALAACEMAGGDAAAFLDAVVRGYEAVIRVGRAVGPGHYAYWHNTGTCGPFGAAMAAASAFGLAQGQAAHALALAGTQSSGLWQTRHDPASMAKQLHTARAAHAGLLAARLAAGGFTGPLEIFEGVQGFFAATCPGADASAILADFGGGWRLHEVSFKPWPACRHAHAAIDAALSIREAVSASDIAAVTVETYSDALTFCDRPRPQTVLEAKFSLQHSVAVSLLRGKPQISDFEPDVFGDPHIRLLAGKTQVEVSADFDNAYPARFGARVTVTDRAGNAHAANMPDALGDPENPLGVEELEHKAMALCAQGRISPAMAARVCETALALASGGSLADFTASLPAAGIRGVV